jgi:predicted transcriptional regulator
LPPKQQVRAILDQLPNDCSIEDVQYGLFVLGRIRKGLEAAERGDIVSHQEVKRRMQKWLSK